MRMIIANLQVLVDGFIEGRRMNRRGEMSLKRSTTQTLLSLGTGLPSWQRIYLPDARQYV